MGPGSGIRDDPTSGDTRLGSRAAIKDRLMPGVPHCGFYIGGAYESFVCNDGSASVGDGEPMFEKEYGEPLLGIRLLQHLFCVLVADFILAIRDKSRDLYTQTT